MIISLVISGFFVAGIFFLTQKIRQSENLQSFLEKKTIKIDTYYTTHGTLLLQDAGNPDRVLAVLLKRLTPICSRVSLTPAIGGQYTLLADGVKDSLLLKSLLTANSNIQWWELYTTQEFAPFLLRADSLLKLEIKKKEKPVPDMAKVSTVQQLLQKKPEDLAVSTDDTNEEHPLFSLLNISSFIQDKNAEDARAEVGFVALKDTPVLNSYLNSPVVQANMPLNAAFIYGMPNLSPGEHYSFIYLYAIRKPEPEPMLDESFLLDASLKSGPQANDCQVLMQFNKLGADRLKRMTSANIGRYIAMVVNNEVLAAPRVEDAIERGTMAYTASGRHEAQLVYLLIKYGPLPAPVTVSHLAFAPEPLPSPFQPLWLLCWALIFSLIFFLVRLIAKASRNIPRAPRQ